MRKINKGEFGYINNRKIRLFVYTIFSLAMVFVIYMTGIIRYHNNKNIFTVLAAVSAIPAAKVAVSYIVIMTRKSITKDRYELISQVKNVDVLYDLLITSTEKIIHIDCAAFKDNSVYCLVTSSKVDNQYISKYVKQFLETEASINTVKVFDNDDKYIKAISSLSNNESGKFDKTIKKLLLIYSM